MNAFEGFVDKVGNLAALPKRGHAIELTRPAGPVQVPIMEAFKRLRDQGIRIPVPELRAQYGETIEVAEVDRIIEHGGINKDIQDDQDKTRIIIGG
jgi:hypothetical protein